MLEIIKALAKLENKTLGNVIEIANKKVDKRGAFEKKYFLKKLLNKKTLENLVLFYILVFNILSVLIKCSLAISSKTSFPYFSINLSACLSTSLLAPFNNGS